ncbi:hypothetical protein [Mesorhizobium sp. ORM16]|uniref:hypothetical protein n=1 Tax=Mesorhizobium sp. ORM16 TaxID=3376989 RepID=UPI00385730F0
MAVHVATRVQNEDAADKIVPHPGMLAEQLQTAAPADLSARTLGRVFGTSRFTMSNEGKGRGLVRLESNRCAYTLAQFNEVRELFAAQRTLRH